MGLSTTVMVMSRPSTAPAEAVDKVEAIPFDLIQRMLPTLRDPFETGTSPPRPPVLRGAERPIEGLGVVPDLGDAVAEALGFAEEPLLRRRPEIVLS